MHSFKKHFVQFEPADIIIYTSDENKTDVYTEKGIAKLKTIHETLQNFNESYKK